MSTTYSYDRLTAATNERNQLLAKAKAVLADAKAADRDLTAPEVAQMESTMARISVVDAEAKAQSAAIPAAIGGLGNSETSYDGGSNALFSEEDGKNLISAIRSKGRWRGEVSTKAALGSTTLLPTAGSLAEPGLHPNAAFAFANLFRQLPADGPTQRVYSFGSATAAVVAEGAAKPDSGLVITSKDVPMVKVATTVQYTSEFAEDAPQLLAFLASELSSAVVTAENASILAAINGTVGILTGTSTTATAIDLISTSIAGQEALNGVSPSAVIVNPSVLGVLRAAKASTGGSYFLDPLLAGPTTIHGVPVVSSAATAPGTAWLVTGNGAVIYRRGGLQVETGTNADDFIHNIETLRVEERFATAVIRPSMFTKLTLT